MAASRAKRGRWSGASVVVAAALVAGATAGPGCSTSRPVPVAAEAPMPADFSIAIVVRVPEAQADAYQAGDRSEPRATRPARYLVEADNVLRVVVGPGALPKIFPPPTRRLTPEQAAGLWAQVRDSGLLTEGETVSREVLGAEFADQPLEVKEPTALISLRAEGRRVYRRAALTEGSAIFRLTDSLAELAWLQ